MIVVQHASRGLVASLFRREFPKVLPGVIEGDDQYPVRADSINEKILPTWKQKFTQAGPS